MKFASIAVALALASGASFGQATGGSSPHDVQVREVMSRNLADIPGKEGLVITVVYPPGGADMVHRHDAHGFVYVLEGTVVMQVKGSPAVTLTAGQGFYEGPDDVHVVGRNASQRHPAKLLVFLVKKQRAPILTPVN